ncbi:MAG: peptide chain release factor N(5)-glutamine methyltransferase [Candidatus Gracilibacteria bacterium]|nr:peptide chain release factor N(5)-glutamine methyltransferase [Candidatus Gracilibacteria bacterium]
MNSTYPPEYTRGWVEFYYQKFEIDEHVLIPRLETESLVREAIRYFRSEEVDTLIDIGTGSGIIPLSILSAVEIPEVFAIDLSPEALVIARKNAENQGKNIDFLESDLLSVFLNEHLGETKHALSLQGKNILIVTNLPYIKQDDWENMSTDTIHEPKLALFGGPFTGFELYEKLFAQIDVFVAKYTPKKLTILAEMGDDQTEIAGKILGKYGWEFSFFADLRGIERFMKIHIR